MNANGSGTSTRGKFKLTPEARRERESFRGWSWHADRSELHWQQVTGDGGTLIQPVSRMAAVVRDFPGLNSGSKRGEWRSTAGGGVGFVGQERPSRSSNSIFASLKVLSRAHSTFYIDPSVKIECL